MADPSQIIIHCNSKERCNQLSQDLNGYNWKSSSLHQDHNFVRIDNTNDVHKFIRGEIQILVCTATFSRGLEFSKEKTVINYDIPKDIEVSLRLGRFPTRDAKFICFISQEDKYWTV